MLLVAGPSPDILKFIQVLCWIIMPVLAIAVGLTIFLHYRKRGESDNDKWEQEGKLLESVSGLVGYTNGNGEYIVFDNSVLIQQYKNSLSYNHARYAALQHDYATMESKYAALALYARNLFAKPKKEIMENPHVIPQDMQADINRFAKDHDAETKELHDKLAHLERSCRQLEQENKALQEQISLRSGTDDERAAIINKWKEENALLRDKAADQEYLQDLVEEKKAQVIFLQGQLEQRIKNLYQSEHQRLQVAAETKQLKTEIETLTNELLLKQEQIDKAQVVVCEKEEQLAEKQEVLNAKMEQIATLENQIKETREQYEQFNTSLAGNRDMIDTLQKQLSEEQSKVQFLTQKLFVNKQAVRRLHKEIAAVVDEDADESPVVRLRPEYNSKGNEDIVMQ